MRTLTSTSERDKDGLSYGKSSDENTRKIQRHDCSSGGTSSEERGEDGRSFGVIFESAFVPCDLLYIS